MSGGKLETCLMRNGECADFATISRTNTYSLRPLISAAVGVFATSLTLFVENMCNICVSK
jgi:hypothetical protein